MIQDFAFVLDPVERKALFLRNRFHAIDTRVEVVITSIVPTSLVGLQGIVKANDTLSNGNVCCEVLLDGDNETVPILAFELKEIEQGVIWARLKFECE
jgi:hypothetical protein